MNAAAEAVMKELPDLVIAYGNSDEYRYAITRHNYVNVFPDQRL
jgi:tRNA(His) guanylyltransferase